jgi:hypothetical protein
VKLRASRLPLAVSLAILVVAVSLPAAALAIAQSSTPPPGFRSGAAAAYVAIGPSSVAEVMHLPASSKGTAHLTPKLFHPKNASQFAAAKQQAASGTNRRSRPLSGTSSGGALSAGATVQASFPVMSYAK